MGSASNVMVARSVIIPHSPEKVCLYYLVLLWHANGELYFNNMQIYSVEYVLQVVCAVECVYCYGR